MKGNASIMNPLVSVIIPNYNEERFIQTTIESVLNLNYENIEVLVVDDGSTDRSRDIVSKFECIDKRVKLICQQNMNASIARNRAIEMAKGEYFYFLDSDDVVYRDAVGQLVSTAIDTQADLVLGNMQEINERGEIITKDLFFENSGLSYNFTDFLGILPAPSNKLFKADVIRENHLVFGNVRIGQDTNFYLKYLLCCKKIAYVSDIIYGWRIVSNSMTHAMDFHIFDIVYSFADIKRFYKKNDGMEYYDDYIRMIEYHTYYRQMDKQRKFKSLAERKLVVDYFGYHLKALGDVTKCKNSGEYLDAIKKCRAKLRFKLLYTSKAYQWFYRVKNG